jgi:hypothetical protein
MDVADPFVNIGNTAGLYSQIAGVLAGFAFTGLLLYLNGARGEEASTQETDSGAPYDTRQDVAVVLFNTLGALIICAILYGELAGGDPASGIAFSSVLLNGLAFSLAILGMFYATALAATSFAHLTAMVAAARFLVGMIGPTICMALIASAALDLDVARCTANAKSPERVEEICRGAERVTLNSPYGLALLFTILIALISLILLFWFRRSAAQSRHWIPLVIAWIILAAAIITVGVNVYLTAQPKDYLLSDVALRVMLIVTFLTLCCFSGMTAQSCHHVVHQANRAKPELPLGHEQKSPPRGLKWLAGKRGKLAHQTEPPAASSATHQVPGHQRAPAQNVRASGIQED